MGILTWILFGLIAGAIAKMIMPGTQGGGWLITIIMGILGAFVGGAIGVYILHWEMSLHSGIREAGFFQSEEL